MENFVPIKYHQLRDFSEKINVTFLFIKQNFKSLAKALIYIAGPPALMVSLVRFLFKIVVGYPKPEEESIILSRHHQRQGALPIQEVNSILTAEQIFAFRQLAHQVHIEENLVKYIVGMVDETRKNPMLFLGASPRASIALLMSAKAFALINGRDFVSPEDIKEMALPVLRHRLQLSPEKEMEGISIDDVVKQIIDKIEVPR